MRAQSMNFVRGAGVLSACVFAAVVAAAAARADEVIRTARPEDPAPLGIGRLVPDMLLAPMEGEARSLVSLIKDRAAAVLVMTSTACPMSTKYAPRLAALEAEYQKRGVAFVFVNGVDAETPVEMARQARQYRFQGPYLADRDHAVAIALGARTTTEVFVLDAARTLVYRGAVDDQYGIGSSRAAPRQTLLRDALEAVLTGQRPRVEATWAPGCLLSLPRAAASPHTPLAPTTYYGEVSRVLAHNCVSCHRPGGAAPFALDTLNAVAGRASMIDAVLRSGLMPPWHGATHPIGAPSPWVADRSLQEADRDLLLAWLRSDHPAGDPAEAPLPARTSNTWTLGEPDVLLTSPGFRLPAEGGLQHARLVFGLGPEIDRWVSAAEFRPVDAGTLHHALVWILAPGTRLPGPLEQPRGLDLLGVCSPSDSVLRLPPGTAKKIPAGSLLLVDMYSRPMGKEKFVALRIALRCVPLPAFEVRTYAASASAFEANAGGDRASSSVEVTLPGEARLLALTPYMRARGREVHVEADTPDGAHRTLLDAPVYDFRWPIRYEFAEPPVLAPGSRVILRGVHDASASDPNGGDGASLQFGAAGDQDALLLAVDVLTPTSK